MKNRVTITDIAQAAGVGRATVSEVLNNNPRCYASAETKARIKATAQKLGYRPNLLARSLKNGRTRMIGYSATLVNEINIQETTFLAQKLQEHRYSTQFFFRPFAPQDMKQSCEALVDQGCDALIISGIIFPDEVEFYQNLPIPVFSLNSRDPEILPNRTIFLNYRSGCEQAIEKLAELGHRQLALLSPEWDLLATDARYQTFLEFYRRDNRACGDKMMLLPDQNAFSAAMLQEFLHRNPEVTGIVCTNDLLAMKTVMFLQELGYQVPQDFSVIGFDDIPSAACCAPGISSIHKPITAAVTELIKLVLNVLEKQSNPVTRQIDTFLINRPSLDKVNSPL